MQRNITSDLENEKKKLAVRCEMGDVAAMMELSSLFLCETSDTCRQLAATYDTDGKSREKFRRYLEDHPDEWINVLAGNMWVIRAAIYGHPEAKKLFMENSVYEECTLMPVDIFLEGKDLEHMFQSNNLRYAGLLGFPENTDVMLSSLENGVYMATTDAGTEGPDETGFGMEQLYDFYQYDKFFHLLHCLKGWSRLDLRIQKVSPFTGKREEAEKKRERYWAIHGGKDGILRYTEQSFVAEDFVIRDGVLTKCMKSDIIYARIPAGVKIIGDGAFYSCTRLTGVTIPNTVEEIGAAAFGCCGSLESIDFPDSVQKIGEQVCADCRKLVSVHLPNGITQIPANAFHICTALKEIIIPDTVTEMDEECFRYSGVEKLKLPKNLKKIGNEAFACSNLLEIKIPDSVEKIGNEAFARSNLLEIKIPDSVKIMGTKTCEWCEKLKYAKLPDTLKTLPSKTFADCKSLEEVCLPSKLISIESGGFEGCESLRHVSFRGNSAEGVAMFPEALEVIEYDAFRGCKSLPAIRIPSHVMKIDSSSFCGCQSPKGIGVSIDNPYFYAKEDMLFEKKDQTLIYALTKKQILTRIPDGTRIIGDGAFSDNKELYSVVIPESVEEIGMSAFSKAENLKSVKMGNNVKKIGVEAFKYCKSLKKITLPQSLMEIGRMCFESCDSLNQVTIPGGVTVLEQDLFCHCESLKDIYISDGVQEIENIFGYSLPSLKRIRIPASVNTIEEMIFYNRFGTWNGLTIIGKRGSLAEKIAKEEKIRFVDETLCWFRRNNGI